LGIRHAYFGIDDKLAVFGEIATAIGVTADETAFIGDDLVDIPLLAQVGFAVTVPDAVEEVRRVAHYVTQRPGGNGAVREICDLLHAHRLR
jgi:3-deoxy-D-manno-octulosonate 8-phosphate phosphatase (KDO 8-P phosphatase)